MVPEICNTQDSMLCLSLCASLSFPGDSLLLFFSLSVILATAPVLMGLYGAQVQGLC